VRIELINTGSELLLGKVLNTHQTYIGQTLTDAGYTLAHQQTVPDTAVAIQAAIAPAIARSPLVLVTGGLGPTSDDLTRQRIAELLNLPLEEHPPTRDRITAWFKKINRPMPETVLVQAQVPAGSIVLTNHHGTAPGLALPTGQGWLILLPGPPRELRPMFADAVMPFLAEKLAPETPRAIRTLKTLGIGESSVEEKLAAPLAKLTAAGLELGFCARVGEVDLRLVSPGYETMLDDAEAIIRDIIGEFIYGRDDDTLEAIILRELTARFQTLAIAESCTGGIISHRFTNVPGASAVFLAGHCTYANTAKQATLGVTSETLAEHGAVSEPTARQMAEGARTIHNADYALATTGIAGPGGGTEEKPVGTVFMALATNDGTEIVKRLNRFDRETFKQVTAQQTMDLLRRKLTI